MIGPVASALTHYRVGDFSQPLGLVALYDAHKWVGDKAAAPKSKQADLVESLRGVTSTIVGKLLAEDTPAEFLGFEIPDPVAFDEFDKNLGRRWSLDERATCWPRTLPRPSSSRSRSQGPREVVVDWGRRSSLAKRHDGRSRLPHTWTDRCRWLLRRRWRCRRPVRSRLAACCATQPSECHTGRRHVRLPSSATSSGIAPDRRAAGHRLPTALRRQRLADEDPDALIVACHVADSLNPALNDTSNEATNYHQTEFFAGQFSILFGTEPVDVEVLDIAKYLNPLLEVGDTWDRWAPLLPSQQSPSSALPSQKKMLVLAPYVFWGCGNPDVSRRVAENVLGWYLARAQFQEYDGKALEPPGGG